MTANIQSIQQAVSMAREGIIAYVRADSGKVEYLTLNRDIIQRVLGYSPEQADSLRDWCDEVHDSAANPDHYAFAMLANNSIEAQKFDMSLMDGMVIPVAYNSQSNIPASAHADHSEASVTIGDHAQHLESVEYGTRVTLLNTIHGIDYPYMVGVTNDEQQFRMHQVDASGYDVDGNHIVRVALPEDEDGDETNADTAYLNGYLILDRRGGPQFVSEDYMNGYGIDLKADQPVIPCYSVVHCDNGFSHIELAHSSNTEADAA